MKIERINFRIILDIIGLLFAPGFSTKEEISELSGRGIGLDAVRNSCYKFEISCKIVTKNGEGSTFQLFIPKKYIKFMINENNTLKLI